jgi:hypothetical protein
MDLPMQAIARVETGSLTPTLSRQERVSRPALGDIPEPRPSEPSRLVPDNARLGPPKSAATLLLLPPGEGRDEGRSLHSSRPGSWSPYVSKFLQNAPTHEPCLRSGGRPACRRGGRPAPRNLFPGQIGSAALSAGQDARLYGRRDACRYNTGVPGSARFNGHEQLEFEQVTLPSLSRS